MSKERGLPAKIQRISESQDDDVAGAENTTQDEREMDSLESDHHTSSSLNVEIPSIRISGDDPHEHIDLIRMCYNIREGFSCDSFRLFSVNLGQVRQEDVYIIRFTIPNITIESLVPKCRKSTSVTTAIGNDTGISDCRLSINEHDGSTNVGVILTTDRRTDAHWILGGNTTANRFTVLISIHAKAIDVNSTPILSKDVASLRDHWSM